MLTTQEKQERLQLIAAAVEKINEENRKIESGEFCLDEIEGVENGD